MLRQIYVVLLLAAAALAASHPNVGLISRWIEDEQTYRLCTGVMLFYNASTAPFVVAPASCALHKTDANSTFNFTIDAQVPIACNESLVQAVGGTTYTLFNASTKYVAMAGFGETLDYAVLQFSNGVPPPVGDLHLVSVPEYYRLFAPASAYLFEPMPVPLDFYDNATATNYSVRFEFSGYGLGVAPGNCSEALGVRSNAAVSRLCREQGYTVAGNGATMLFGAAGATLSAVDANTDESIATLGMQFVRVAGGRTLAETSVPIVIIPGVKLEPLLH